MYKQKKADKVDPLQARRAKWSCCSLSGKPLQEPVVADEYGSLFNKLDVLLGMQARKAGEPWPADLAHIARVKDLLLVKPTLNSNYRVDSAHSAERPSNDAPFECPVAGVPLNGAFRSVLHRATGVLLSDKALKQAPAAVRGLLVDAAQAALQGREGAGGAKGGDDRAALDAVVAAEGAWQENDWLVVNPEGADAEAAKDRVELIVAKRIKKKGPKDNDANKRSSAPPANPVVRKKVKTSVLDSLFHEDGEGARVEETFLCRSVGARGMNLT